LRGTTEARPLARTTALMSVGTVLSRITGVARLAAIAAALGVAETRLTDTYNLANTAPNIIYELVLGGILTSVFVPLFVELQEKEGNERAWEIANGIINVATAVLLAVSLVGVLAAPLIANLYSSRLTGSLADAQHDALTLLLRLFIPQIVFYGLAATTAGLLNANRRFLPPMYTPVLNNLTVIGTFVGFYFVYGRVGLENVTTQQLMWIGIGTTAGVVVMATTQVTFLRSLGRYRFTFNVRHPSVVKAVRLSVFVIGYVMTNQIGYLAVQWLANGEPGGYSAYVFAFTFFMLPHGLFAVSVMTALLPSMSQHAVNERWDEFGERLSTGIRASLLLILPAAVVFFVLGEDIVRLLLERGVMTGASTELVASVLRFFVIGLLPFALFQLFLRAYYALQNTKTPFLVNVAAVALNMAINVPMFIWLGVEGLAAGHAAAYLFGSFALGHLLAKRIGGFDRRRIVRSAVRIGAAATAMGLAMWGPAAILRDVVGVETFLDQLVVVALPVALGGAIYLGTAVLLQVEEMQLIRSILGRRFAGNKPSASG
jgi:putative peptidoglycan lipid II flippase